MAKDRSTCVWVAVVGSVRYSFESEKFFVRFVEKSHVSGGTEINDNVLHESPVSPPRILCKPRQGDDGEEDIWSGRNGEIKELSQGLTIWDVLHVVTLIIIFRTIIFGRIVTVREWDRQ